MIAVHAQPRRICRTRCVASSSVAEGIVWEDGNVPEDDELDRKVRKLTVEHAETRWLALRLDDDIKEVREVQREHTARLDAIDGKLQEHTALLQEHSARFDSVDRQLQEHNARFDAVDRQLQEHSLRFDSVESVLRSLHQMVGQVLDRLPEEPAS
jgi:chromosome segregation ATPase